MKEFERISIPEDSQFGTFVGTRFKASIQGSIARTQELYPDSIALSEIVYPYKSPTIQYAPDIVDQLATMATAADVPLDRLFAQFVPEILEQKRWIHGPPRSDTPLRCTTAIRILDNGTMILGHNEDWENGDPGEHIALLETPTFFGIWYKSEGLGSAIGVNRHGIWQCVNQVDTEPLKYGVPRLITAWKLTHMHTVADAVRYVQDTPQASAYIYEFVQSGAITRVEHFGGETVVHSSRGSVVSTNHFIYPPFTDLVREYHAQSAARYAKAAREIDAIKTPEDMQRLLSARPISRDTTLASVVATDDTMYVHYGRPRKNAVYASYNVLFSQATSPK